MDCNNNLKRSCHLCANLNCKIIMIIDIYIDIYICNMEIFTSIHFISIITSL